MGDYSSASSHVVALPSAMIRVDVTTSRAAEAPYLQGDPVLEPFLRAHAAEASRHLATLIAEQVTPVIRRVVRYQMLARGASRHPAEELEDIEADGVADVIARLADLREAFNPEPIANFAGYVATVASNACHRNIRRRRPNRARLKNRLRYLFSHDAALAIWPAATGGLLCGRQTHRGSLGASDGVAKLRALAEDAAAVRAAAAGIGAPSEIALARIVAARIPEGVELDDLTELVADILGITDFLPVEQSTAHCIAEEPATREPSVLTTLADRGELQRLWDEVRELPVRQRAALLLNLRDADGGGILGLFPLTGVATMRDIAAALEMPVRDVAELWGKLPIEDARIAERLGISRQQVINLRKAARERLARRLSR